MGRVVYLSLELTSRYECRVVGLRRINNAPTQCGYCGCDNNGVPHPHAHTHYNTNHNFQEAAELVTTVNTDDESLDCFRRPLHPVDTVVTRSS